MSCKNATDQPSQTCDSQGSTGVPQQSQNQFACMVVQNARAGLLPPYEMAVVGIEADGSGYSIDDLLILENVADERGWTLAHEMAFRGYPFTAAEVRLLGNPADMSGKALDDVVYEATGHWPKMSVPQEFFASEDEFADFLNNEMPDTDPGALPWIGQMHRDCYRFALCFEQPQNIQHIKKLMGYIARTNLAIPGKDGWDSDDVFLPEQPEGETAQLFIFPCDFTKSYSDDIASRFYGRDGETREAYLGVAHALQNGSPIRTTNRAGPGTKGTRLVDGVKGRFVWAFD